ncbi:MAG: helix-turn-helix domain-containing protein [Myxococcota bacterium]
MRFAHERLSEARLALELTQDDLARSIGVDVRTYRRYESGAVNAGGFDVRRAERRRIVERLASELGVPVEELVVEAPRGGPHHLPPTPAFVGRADLLADLTRWRDADDRQRVVAVVAIGGAGKTALAAQLCERAFVWSFYQDPKVEGMVDALLIHLGQAPEPAGARMERIERALAGAGPLLLVLDGVEVVQADGLGQRSVGELEDSGLRRLLVALATGLGRARALLTTRAGPPELERLPGYRRIDLPPLAADDSEALVATYGVNDPAAAQWAGGHPLSLGMVGVYLGGGGRLADLDQLDLREHTREDPLARRLLTVLEALAARLTAEERAVFAALSIFPSGATAATLAGLPIAVPARAIDRALGKLRGFGLAASDGSRAWLHPLVARFAGTLLEQRGAPLHEAERARLAETLGSRLDITDPGVLDRVERLVHHTVGAGRAVEAYLLYQRALGGFAHLGLRQGEMARGARLTRAFGEGLPPRDQVNLRYEEGLFAVAQGDLRGGVAAFARVASGARTAGDGVVLTTALRALAYAQRLAGDLDEALETIDAAAAVAEGLDDPPHVVRAVAMRGAILDDQGRSELAGQAFAAVRALGDDPMERRGLWEAEHLVARGEWSLARERTVRNQERCAARRWPGHVAHCDAVLGTIAARSGDAEAGAHHLGALRSWTDRTGEVELVLRAHLLAAELGDNAEARIGAEKARRLGYRPLAERLTAFGGGS